MNFVVLSSSNGTTFQAVLDAIATQALTATCAGLITDKEDRGCVAKAQAAGVSVRIVNRKPEESREQYDQQLHAAIQELSANCDIVACLGWMRLLSPWFVQKWPQKILNVHPSLLPKYPGGHAIEDTLAANETETGMTIHYIDEGVDTGPIVVQKKCSIKPNDTVETVKDRIQKLEKEWYPIVLQQIQEAL